MTSPHIQGLLHQGCKLILAGTSKTNKTWSLLDLGLSAAAGQPWWGLPTTRCHVLYLNFELPDWALLKRITAITTARPELQGIEDQFHPWNLRGHSGDFTHPRPRLQAHLERFDFGLIILDPAYKLLGDRDENDNGEITALMNEFERLADETGAALVLAHHFAKGDASVKDPVDRMSGAGAWARDPDSILILTPHEERDCYTLHAILRNMPMLPEFVLEWDYPIMRRAEDLNPAAIRTRYSQRKSCSDREFLEAAVGSAPRNAQRIVQDAAQLGVSERTTFRYLKRLSHAGLVRTGNGLYWKSER